MGIPEPSRWRIELPGGAYEVRVPSPPECSSMAHLRGEIAPGAPFFGVVSTRRRTAGSAMQLAADLAAAFVEPAEPRKLSVRGSRRAARVDGLIDMGEGLSEDGVERIATTVAELRDEFVVLTIRTRPCDVVEDAIEGIIASFRVEPAA